MRHEGRMIKWNDDRGFGFITPNGGGQQVFVHIKSFTNRRRRPVENEIVSYELNTDAKGRTQADRVVFVSERTSSDAASGWSIILILFATGFVAFVAGSAFVGKLPLAVSGLYMAASTVAFIAYALDKSAAKNDQWRTPETTLQVFGLLGGWPGALVAQRLLRHKSRKLSFQITFWTTVVLNCSALGWLFTPTGAEALRAILGTL